LEKIKKIQFGFVLLQKSSNFALKLLQKSFEHDMILLQNNKMFGVKILRVCI